jgi:hypothetical protein
MVFHTRKETTTVWGETIMPKKIIISLSGIVQQIDEAIGKLSSAKGKAANVLEKRKLDVKIRKLKQVRKEAREPCRGLNIEVNMK